MTKSSEIIFNNGSDLFKYMLEDIALAQKSIDLETYTFNKQGIGTKIGEALIAAAQRGVRVRLLVDGAGTPRWGGVFTKKIEKAGIETRIFHPFPWGLWQWSRSVVKMPSMLKAIYLLLKINSRNHRKVCLIDDCIAYVGSMNIDRCHLKKEDGGKGWRDTSVRLTRMNLYPLTDAFEAAWLPTPWKERLHALFDPICTDAPIRLNHTRHARRLLYKNLLKRISRSQERIWITNAYFIPDNFLLKKLKDTARKGVDVRILLPRKSDVLMMPWASAAFYKSLLKAGIRIFEYLPSVLHAKTLILDDWITLGTSNLNHRSLLHDLEVDITIRSKYAKSLLVEHFLVDLKHSEEIHLSTWEKRPFYQHLVGKLLLYLKYIA